MSTPIVDAIVVDGPKLTIDLMSIMVQRKLHRVAKGDKSVFIYNDDLNEAKWSRLINHPDTYAKVEQILLNFNDDQAVYVLHRELTCLRISIVEIGDLRKQDFSASAVLQRMKGN